MTVNSVNSQAFRLKGRLYTFTVLQVLNSDTASFEQQLAQTVSKAPKMFINAPVVLDFSGYEKEDVNLQKMADVMRAQGMIPVAIQASSPYIETLAQCMGMPTLKSSESMDKTIEIDDKPVQQDASSHRTTKLITTPVRSGQQIVAKDCDLIVSASVGRGAELLADGHIHVYGPLRGRALAGISGDKTARIFCQSIDAELVSIAGYYRLSDAITKSNDACQIFLENDQIQIEPIK